MRRLRCFLLIFLLTAASSKRKPPRSLGGYSYAGGGKQKPSQQKQQQQKQQPADCSVEAWAQYADSIADPSAQLELAFIGQPCAALLLVLAQTLLSRGQHARCMKLLGEVIGKASVDAGGVGCPPAYWP